jgi:hypothetical protein
MRSSQADVSLRRGLFWVIFLGGSLALCIAVLAGCGGSPSSARDNAATTTPLTVSATPVAVGAGASGAGAAWNNFFQFFRGISHRSQPFGLHSPLDGVSWPNHPQFSHPRSIP